MLHADLGKLSNPATWRTAPGFNALTLLRLDGVAAGGPGADRQPGNRSASIPNDVALCASCGSAMHLHGVPCARGSCREALLTFRAVYN